MYAHKYVSFRNPAVNCTTGLTRNFSCWKLTVNSIRGLPILREQGDLTKHGIKYNLVFQPWLVWLSGLSVGLWTEKSLVPFPVMAHAWVMGQVPAEGATKGNHTMMFLSLSFSLPFSKNSWIKSLKKDISPFVCDELSVIILIYYAFFHLL